MKKQLIEGAIKYGTMGLLGIGWGACCYVGIELAGRTIAGIENKIENAKAKRAEKKEAKKEAKSE